jgi:hypothetical protein
MLHKLLHIRERYHTLEEELTPMLHKLLHIIEREGTPPTHSVKTVLPRCPNWLGSNTNAKKKYRPISLMNIDAKILNNINKS